MDSVREDTCSVNKIKDDKQIVLRFLYHFDIDDSLQNLNKQIHYV